MDKVTKLAQALREGGHTERMHTVPHLGGYNVAEHSWNMAVLATVLHPGPSTTLLLAILMHDIAERWTGDIPAPAKWYTTSGKLGKELKKLEDRVEKALGIDIHLNSKDRAWLKGLDMLEFIMWCHDEQALGNRHVMKYLFNAMKWMHDNKRDIPPEVYEFASNYEWSRTGDLLDPEITNGYNS